MRSLPTFVAALPTNPPRENRAWLSRRRFLAATGVFAIGAARASRPAAKGEAFGAEMFEASVDEVAGAGVPVSRRTPPESLRGKPHYQKAPAMNVKPLLAGPLTAHAATPRSALLLRIADDQNCEVGCYRNKIILTPHRDRLASLGVRFIRAYCNHPVWLFVLLLSACLTASALAAGSNPELTLRDGRFELDGAAFQMWGIRVGSATKDQAQTDHLLAQLDDYRRHGVNAVTVFYMGCSGAAYDPFSPDGKTLDAGHQRRMEQIIHACAERKMAVIAGIFYQRAKIGLRDAEAFRAAVRTVAISLRPFRNVVLNIANEQNTYAQLADRFDLRRPERIVELCRVAHEVDPRRIVGAGGHDQALNIAIGRAPEVDALLFDCNSARGTTGDYCDQFVAAGVVNKPLINVELFDVVTRRYERGVFPEEFQQRHAAEIASVVARPAAGLFFHNTPWCQVEPMRYDLAGAGTKEDPGIRWYFEQVRAKTRPAPSLALRGAGFEIRDAAEFAHCVPEGAKPTKLADGFRLSEGPVWLEAERALVFSDVPNDEMKQWTVAGGVTSYRRPSQHANGNALDRAGRLVTCESLGRRVVVREKDGTVKTLVESFEGKKLNGPNDVVVKSDGSVWFTDPDVFLKTNPETKKKPDKEQPGNFVYRHDPKTGATTAVVRNFSRPNGLAFSPDETKLYVTDTGAAKHIRVFDVRADGTLSGGKVFCQIEQPAPGTFSVDHAGRVLPADIHVAQPRADGIRVDRDGRVWSSAGDGVQIFTPDGGLIGKILLPESPSNLCFGGADGKTLFITTRKSLYSIGVAVMEAAAKPHR